MKGSRSRSTRGRDSGASYALLLLALLLVLLAAAEAAAQAAPVLRPGDTVRVRAGGASSVSEVIRVVPGALVLRSPDGMEMVMPVASTRRIEVRVPRTRVRQIGHDALVGGLIGGATGAVIGIMSPPDPDCWVCFTPAEAAMMAGTVLGVAGLTVGAVIGAVRPKSAAWRRVAPERLALEMAPAAAGVRLSLAWRP